MGSKEIINALKPEQTLHWYRITRVLGQGAFGITYLAEDINLERQVAIKEYMPGQLCARSGDLTIQPLSDEHREDFQWGLTRFIAEARTLTKFEHPNLVRVFNVFELNNTAYMVMNYEVGESLQQILKRKKTLGEKELIRIMLPLMSGLQLIHDKGFIHRDIKPGNVFIRSDGSPVLLDFGSARQTRDRGEAQTLTNFVSPGYAPIEQYTSKSDRQGPWTDIYGLGATLYRAITGISPTTAIDRSEMIMNGINDDFKSLSALMKGRYSDSFLASIDHALAFNAEDRPKTIAEWREEFDINEEDVETMPAFIPDPEPHRPAPAAAATLKLNDGTVKTAVMTAAEATTVNIASAASTTITLAASARARLEQWIRYHRYAAAGGAAAVILALAVATVLLARGPAETTAAVAAAGQPPASADTTAETTTDVPEVAATGGTDTTTGTTAETGGGETAIPVAAAYAPVSENNNTAPPAADAAAAAEHAAGTETAASGGENGTTPAAPVKQAPQETAAVSRTATAAPAGRKIPALLRQAEADIDALRLMTPEGNNAYERYRQVLALDKDNADARKGLQSISDKYVQLAYGAMDAGKQTLAGVYLDRARKITPASPDIARARVTLLQRQKQSRQREAAQAKDQDSGGTFMDDVVNWFKQNTGKAKPAKQESSTSEGVRKALGGR